MSSCVDWKCLLVAIYRTATEMRVSVRMHFFFETSLFWLLLLHLQGVVCCDICSLLPTHFFLPQFQVRCNLFCCKMSSPHANGLVCKCATDSQSICRMCVASRVGGDGYAGDALSDRTAKYDMQVRCRISIFHRIPRVLRKLSCVFVSSECFHSVQMSIETTGPLSLLNA